MDISGWIRDHLTGNSDPESSEIESENESGLFSLSDQHTGDDEITVENPGITGTDDQGIETEMNFKLSEEELKMHAFQIEKAKGLYRLFKTNRSVNEEMVEGCCKSMFASPRVQAVGFEMQYWNGSGKDDEQTTIAIKSEMKDLEIAFSMLFFDSNPIKSKAVQEIKPEDWSNEDTGKVLAWSRGQLNGKKWKKAAYNYKKQEKRTKQIEESTERNKERFSREWLRTGEKRKAETLSESEDGSDESGYDGRINRKHHLKRPKLQDDKLQGEKRKLPLNKILTKSDLFPPKVDGQKEAIIVRIWFELEQTSLSGGETPICDSIVKRLQDPNYHKNLPTPEDLALWLSEPNIEELKGLYGACGPEFMLKCYLHTVYVELRGGMDTDISGYQQRRRTSGGVFFRTARFRYHLTDEQVKARDQIIDDNFCQFQDQCLQEMQNGGSVKEKLLCQPEQPESLGPLYEPN